MKLFNCNFHLQDFLGKMILVALFKNYIKKFTTSHKSMLQ